MAEEIEEACDEVSRLAKNMSFRSPDLRFFKIWRAGATKSKDAALLWVKLEAECLCYKYEINPNDNKLRLKLGRVQKSAIDYANKHLPAHPARLEIILDHCRFLRGGKKPQEALRLAKSTFDDAVACLDSLADVSYKDTTLALQQLRDHVTAWGEEEREKEREREEARRREEERAREVERKEEEKKRRTQR